MANFIQLTDDEGVKQMLNIDKIISFRRHSSGAGIDLFLSDLGKDPAFYQEDYVEVARSLGAINAKFYDDSDTPFVS